MFSLNLSDPQGKYRVGATTFARPVSPLVVGTAKLVSGDQLLPALQLDEVAFTAYYPAQTEGSIKGLDWLIRPVRDSLRGYVHFAGLSTWLLWPVVYLFGTLLKIPVYPNAPLLKPPADGPLTQWPLVIFSHGLGGGRTAYSQLCSRLAASGKVVLALEHRDGTGPACMIRSLGPDGKPSEEYNTKLYIQDDDIQWDQENDTKQGPLPIRADQLTFRQHEIYLAYASFRDLVQSTARKTDLEIIDGTGINLESWSPCDTHPSVPVQCDADVSIVGHSFGGCTVFSMLSTPPPATKYLPIPITKALALDPWLEPLASPGPAPYLQNHEPSPLPLETALDAAAHVPSSRSSSSSNTVVATPDIPLKHPRLLVINSEGFTLWKDHFSRLHSLVDAWEPEGRRLLTIVRSQHISFSDFPVLPLIRGKAAQRLMTIIGTLSLAFLDGRLEEGLGECTTREMEVELLKGKTKWGEQKKRLVGELGDVVVH